MAEIESQYRKVDGKVLIEIDLSSVKQIFNTFDHAPFHEKELDANAEHYIVDIVDDFPLKTPFLLNIYMHGESAFDYDAKTLPQAIHSHFQYRTLEQDQIFRARFRYGRWALLIGLVFVAIAMILRQLVSTILGSSHLISQIIADSLLIIGWAAMWEPVTVLLYELWPIIKKKKIYEKISHMEIVVIPSE